MNRKLEIYIGIATIIGVVIAAIALVPSFGQWLFPIEPTLTPQATATPEPPHAPSIENSFGTQLYDEQVITISLAPGEKEVLRVMNIWSTPEGTPAGCATGFIAFTWMIRVPYPTTRGDLEFHRIIPRGGGRTELFANGATGSSDAGMCDEITLYNTGLEDYYIEFRYASGTYEE